MILLLWTFAEQSKLLHNSLNTLMIHLKPAVQKLMVYPSYTISFLFSLKMAVISDDNSAFLSSTLSVLPSS